MSDASYYGSELPEFDDNGFPDCNEYSKENIDSSYINCLKTSFGHSYFRPMQWQIISSVIQRKQDNLAIMATGYGKSLCFQFPSVYLNTVTIVVSPLISLMEDQVLSLTISNIKACILGSAQSDKSIYGDVERGEYRLVYVTPELITSEFGVSILKSLLPRLTLIAIDEAHCISKWGHDFRSAFRNLGIIRSNAPNIPILAMTATATEKVQKDIVASLKLRNLQQLCTGFDRPNLEFNVNMKGNQGVWSDIGNLLKSVRLGSTIVYCLTRKQTDDIAAVLKMNNIKCEPYHAGLTLKQRKSVHEEFSRDKVRVIVATIAFGMGIDKPDVRQVIHYGAARDLESYYQEVGRAGRDGLFSKCFMFYSHGDFQIHANLRDKANEVIQRNLDVLSMKMREYINTTECRRWTILQYFEGTAPKIKPRSKCCDNCERNMTTENISSKYEDLDNQGFYDFAKDAELLMKALEVFNCHTGLTIPVLFLRGSKVKKINPRYYTHELYGKGKSKSDDWWKSVSFILEEKKLLGRETVKSQYQTYNKMQLVVITQQGYDWLQNGIHKPLKIKLPKDMYRFLKLKKTDLNTTGGPSRAHNPQFSTSVKIDEKQELVKALLKVRASLSSELDVMPYMICSNRALYQMAQVKPLNQNEMREAKLDGFSDIKITKFGPKFIECVLQTKNFLIAKTENHNSLENFLLDHPMPGLKITNTHLLTLDLVKTDKNINQIAQIRGISESTVYKYLCDLIKAGQCSTRTMLRKFGVDDQTFTFFESKISTEEIISSKLSEIKSKCPPSITWDKLRLVVSYFQLKAHLKANNADLAELQKTELKEAELQEVKLTKAVSQNAELQAENYRNGDVDSSTNSAQSIQPNSHRKEDVDNYFDSDNDIDFSQIDEVVANNSLISFSSSPIGPSQTSVTAHTVPLQPVDLCSDDELDKAIIYLKDADVQNENDNRNSQVSIPTNTSVCQQISLLKRKRIAPAKIAFVESSSDEDEPPKSVKAPEPKRQLPGWLSTKKFHMSHL